MSEDYFVAVHGGAGYHHPDNDKRTKRALRLACTKAIQSCLSSKSSPGDPNASTTLDLVEQAIISLEDDAHLNAGYGSNLTLDGTVECDAAVFAAQGGGQFGSVGAVSGIKNPISAARGVLEYSQRLDKLGRVPPMMLVAQGAIEFARKHCGADTTVSPESMISPSSAQTWEKWKDRLDYSALSAGEMMSEVEKESLLQDTVGAVAWHPRDGLAAGVSSGGILLKLSGRIGEAAVFGAGCWAQHQSGSLDGMACSISGTGEQIIRANLARTIGEACTPDSDPHEVLQTVLMEKFWKPAKERGEHNPAAGVLMITRETDGNGQRTARAWCGFTTASMAIAFASSKDPRPKAYILRRPEPRYTGSEGHVYITAFGV
ncbi:asparaginase [Macrolepiota fuliginosa MF-IS2]|uniref:Asparaginase n=1 Tax=Macrolepiota fuliginosa MF-IS2 TaxID=1400762 RepID=A0A9P5XMB2_9AGAR|nr:asparaginase [Macrolepiota fuliginosa MF-IS2]